MDKLELRTNVYFFVRYPRGMKCDLFYCPMNQKVIVSTNALFLEENYVINYKLKNRIILEELRGNRLTRTSSIPIVQEEEAQDRVIDIPLPRRSGRNVVTQADTERQHAYTIKAFVPHLGQDDSVQGSESVEQFIPNKQTQVVPRCNGRVIRKLGQ